MKQGLSHRFHLKQGKFVMSTGPEKVKDNLYFLMIFDRVSRIYRDDFAPKVLWLVQKPTSFVNNYKVLLLGRFRKVILKYVLEITVNSIDLVNERANGDPKSYSIYINYSYKGENGEIVEDTAIQFI